MYVTAGNFAFFDFKRAYHSQFSKVNRRQSPRFRRIRKKTLQTSVFLIKMADEEGFEPPIRVTPYTRFRVARIQPLCHSSKQQINKIFITNLQVLFLTFQIPEFLSQIKLHFLNKQSASKKLFLLICCIKSVNTDSYLFLIIITYQLRRNNIY